MPAFVQALKKPLRFAFGLKKNVCARRENGLTALKAKASVHLNSLQKICAASQSLQRARKKISKKSCSFADIGVESKKKYNQSDMRSSSGTPCRPEIRSSELDLKDSANPLVGMYIHDLTGTV